VCCSPEVEGVQSTILENDARDREEGKKKRRIDRKKTDVKKRRALDMSSDLFFAIKDYMKAPSIGGRSHFSPGQMDDVDAFWRWIVDMILPNETHNLMALKREQVFVSSDWKLVFPQTPKVEINVGGVIVNVLEQPEVPIHALLTPNHMDADISFNFEKDEGNNEADFKVDCKVD
jgi:hypothetical protein